MSEGKLIFSL